MVKGDWKLLQLSQRTALNFFNQSYKFIFNNEEDYSVKNNTNINNEEDYSVKIIL